MRKNLKFAIALLLLMCLFGTTIFAVSTASKANATMSLVENNVCNITFGKYGEFEKKLIKCDTENKTIDIGLTVKNNQEEEIAKAGEVVLLIDASNSMSTNPVSLNGETMTRKQLVLDSASKLVDKLFENNADIKIGVVEFATSTDTSKEGTDADAKAITTALTNVKTEVANALSQVSTDVMGARTDIEVGLDTARKLLSDSTDTNKYIVVLTDAIPNTAKGVVADLYTEASADPTKAKLKELSEDGVNIISMLIDISEDDILITGRPEDATFETYKDVANYVFGTALAPTAGSVYYVEDDKVLDTVTNSIYNELMPKNEYVLTDIVIKDHFPQNIIDNFEFAALTEANIGKISAKVDTTDNSITWTIPELKPGEVGSFTYRLSLKDTFSSEIVGVKLPTNKNVTIDYKENDKDMPQKSNDKCPVVMLDLPAPKDIPQTGSNTWIVASLIIASIGIATISFINLKKNS